MSGTELARRPTSPVEQMLVPRADVLAKMIPSRSGIKVERLIKQAAMAAYKNPEIAKCDPASIVASVTQAAELGLDLSGPLGSAYLVPYKRKCQLIIGYRGLIELVHRSGRVKSIEARVAHENEPLEIRYGTDACISHVPAREHRGRIVGAYAIAHLACGGMQFEWMWDDEINEVRRASPGKDQAPWRDHYAEMARKTVTRRLCKYLPMMPEVRYAVELDEDGDGEQAPVEPRTSPVDEINIEIVASQGGDGGPADAGGGERAETPGAE